MPQVATHYTHADHAGGEDGSSTQEGHQNPGNSGTDDEHRIEDHVEGERKLGLDTGLLKELDTLTNERLTTQDLLFSMSDIEVAGMTHLHSKCHHGNLGPSSIDTLEALDIARPLGYLPLHLCGVDHVSNRVVNLSVGE